MTDLDELAWLEPDEQRVVLEREPRPCRRHQWAEQRGHPFTNLQGDVIGPGTLLGVFVCSRCSRIRDEAVVRRNNRNRKNGRSTSAELSKYLGGRNVEVLGLPWDVEGRGYRIQSKREMTGRSPAAIRKLIEGIAASDDLRAAYIVVPRVRLVSGRIYVLVSEWVQEHGWELPQGTLLHAGTPLLALPLPVFREVHIGTTAEAVK